MNEIMPSSKPFRRVRKHVGETWSPDTRNSPNTRIGPWCQHCRQIHPWKSHGTLGTKYEKRNTVWYILWVCLKTGNVIRETGIGTGARKW